MKMDVVSADVCIFMSPHKLRPSPPKPLLLQKKKTLEVFLMRNKIPFFVRSLEDANFNCYRLKWKTFPFLLFPKNNNVL